MSDTLFFQELSSFSDFSELTNERHFSQVPGSWFVIIADIRDSTAAIESGHYKDVNTIGAAVISSVHRELDHEFPYVFGGDGATLLVSHEDKQSALNALRGVKRLARDQFGLDLRIGVLPIEQLIEAGQTIEVAKFELTAGRCVAFIRGGGVTYADALFKEKEAAYCDTSDVSEVNELKGLSCRWQNVSSKRGRILSLLIMSRNPHAPEVFDEVIGQLNEILNDDLNTANPISHHDMHYRSFSEVIRNECRYHSSKWSFSFLKGMLEIILSVLIFRYKIPAFFFDAQAYAQSMGTHSDYRKFDDMLRMIIDCTHEQAKQIKSLLNDLYKEGAVFYGMHESDSSLMTCYVENTKPGGHIHFVDGGDGGYAMAAKQLKQMMAEETKK